MGPSPHGHLEPGHGWLAGLGVRAGPLAAAWGAPETETEAQGAWTWASAAAATLKLLATCAECSFLARAYCKLALLKLEASLQQAAFLRVLKKKCCCAQL